MADLLQALRDQVAASKRLGEAEQPWVNPWAAPLAEPDGKELHQDDSGHAFYADAPIVADGGSIPQASLSGGSSGSSKGSASGDESTSKSKSKSEAPPKASKPRELTPEEMMRMADALQKSMTAEHQARMDQGPAARRLAAGAPDTDYQTELTTGAEAAYQKWKDRTSPNDSGQDYDLRGAFAAGMDRDSIGHLPDTFKKPNHETFSDESTYAQYAPDRAGRWQGDRYIAALDTPGSALFSSPGETKTNIKPLEDDQPTQSSMPARTPTASTAVLGTGEQSATTTLADSATDRQRTIQGLQRAQSRTPQFGWNNYDRQQREASWEAGKSARALARNQQAQRDAASVRPQLDAWRDFYSNMYGGNQPPPQAVSGQAGSVQGGSRPITTGAHGFTTSTAPDVRTVVNQPNVSRALSFIEGPKSYNSDLGPGDYTHSLLSDERKKENTSSPNELTSFLEALKPYSFDYKNPEAPGQSPGRKVGVMAQDLEKSEIGKQAVVETPHGKMVDFGKLAPTTLAGLVTEHNSNEDQDLRLDRLEELMNSKKKGG